MTKYVYDFTEGGKDQKDLLGGKGANLCEITNLGLPVPPGFVISTEACRAYLATAADAVTRLPEGLQEEIDEHLDGLEKEMGKRLGDAEDPHARMRRERERKVAAARRARAGTP